MVGHLSVARTSEALAVSWNTANDAVLAEGRRVLIEDPGRFDGVAVIGVDEHVWRHTRRGDKYVTFDHRPDPDPRRHRSVPAAGHGAGPLQAGVQVLAGQPASGMARGLEVVAMSGFTGIKTATAEELPDATAVMGPFHVVRLAGAGLGFHNLTTSIAHSPLEIGGFRPQLHPRLR